LNRLCTKYKFHCATIGKNIIPSQPALIPGFTVDLQALYMIVCVAISVASGTGNQKFLATTEIDSHGLEPWGVDKKGGLPSDGIKSNHIPE